MIEIWEFLTSIKKKNTCIVHLDLHQTYDRRTFIDLLFYTVLHAPKVKLLFNNAYMQMA